MIKMLPKLLAATALLALTACGESSVSWDKELGSEVDKGQFGNATMNNTLIQSGELSYTVALAERFAAEVPDTINVILEYPNEVSVAWQSTFSNSRYGLGCRILGSDGTIEWLMGTTDMVSGKAASGWTYAPEKLNRPDGVAIKGDSKGENHYINFVECVRSPMRNCPWP